MAVTSLSQSRLSGVISKPGATRHSTRSNKRKHAEDELEQQEPLTPTASPASKKPKLLVSRHTLTPSPSRANIARKPAGGDITTFCLKTPPKTPERATSPAASSNLTSPPSPSRVRIVQKAGNGTIPFEKLSKVSESNAVSASCTLPSPLQGLIKLHRYFLKALALTFAHNGSSTQVHLSQLLKTITRLWRERAVTRTDVQRMLALYELSPEMKNRNPNMQSTELSHSKRPFKLRIGGAVTYVEYIGLMSEKGKHCLSSTMLDENAMQRAYTSHVDNLWLEWTNLQLAHLSFLSNESLDGFPLLQCEAGTQTIARQMQAKSKWAELMRPPTSKDSLKNNKSSPTDENAKPSAIVKGRKQSLLSRIQAKQHLLQSKGKPTPEDILRKHALGKIEEVVEILRMLQQQQIAKTGPKQRDSFNLDARTSMSRVSFSLSQLQRSIKDSVWIPISDEETTMCLKILSEDLRMAEGEGQWVKMVERKNSEVEANADKKTVVFVVLEGSGVTGKEAAKMLREMNKER